MDPTQEREGLGSYVAGTGSSLTGGPAGSPNQDDKTMGMLAHLGAALGWLISLPFLAPLVLLLTKGKMSPFVRFHAAESLNLLITGTIVSLVTCGIGFLIVFPVTVIFNIIAAIKANEGELYRYPIPIWRPVK